MKRESEYKGLNNIFYNDGEHMGFETGFDVLIDGEWCKEYETADGVKFYKKGEKK